MVRTGGVLAFLSRASFLASSKKRLFFGSTHPSVSFELTGLSLSERVSSPTVKKYGLGVVHEAGADEHRKGRIAGLENRIGAHCDRVARLSSEALCETAGGAKANLDTGSRVSCHTPKY